MKRMIKVLLSELVAVAVLCCPALAIKFPDVDGASNYEQAIDYISDYGLMLGDDQGYFNPDAYVTRSEMATIIHRIYTEEEWGLPDGWEKKYQFMDVPATHWAYTAIAVAAKLGIVNGYGDGRFGPADAVTYEQAVTMIVRTFRLEKDAAFAGGYPDGYIAVARNNGFINNMSANAASKMTRAQIAMLFYNALTSKDSVWAIKESIEKVLQSPEYSGYSTSFLEHYAESDGIITYRPRSSTQQMCMLVGVEYDRASADVKLYSLSGRVVETFHLNR